MLQTILALIFIIKTFSSKFNAPKFISSHYGCQCLSVLRRLERACRAKTKRKADVNFLQKCVIYNLTPKFLRFKLYKKSIQEIRNTRSYRKALLLYEIKQQEKDIVHLSGKIKTLKLNLKQQVGSLTWIGILRFIKECEIQELRQAQLVHTKKLCSLGLHVENMKGMNNVITNLSARQITQYEISVLNKGLNFGILSNFFNFLQIQASLERIYQETRPFLKTSQLRIELKRLIINLYSKYKSGYFFAKRNKKFNINENEYNALKNLKQDSSIIICKPDKGNGVVILNKKDYVSKMETIIFDKTKFKLVNNNNNLDQLRKFQGFIFRLKKNGCLTDDNYRRIRPVAASTPILYGNPKVHKDNIPMRPIISSIGSFNHDCAAWLSEILTPLRNNPATVKDTFEFLDKLSGIDAKNQTMATFDAKSLFTNILVNFKSS